MKNLPEGMKPDRDNVVYYDTEKGQFYIIKWEDNGNGDTPIRYYIPLQIKQSVGGIGRRILVGFKVKTSIAKMGQFHATGIS